MRRVIVALIGVLLFDRMSPAVEYQVSSAREIVALSGKLQPGDEVVMANGTWNDQEIRLQARGTEEKPITLRAETAGEVLLTGQSSLEIGGEYVVVSGLWLNDGKDAKNGVALTGRHCRLTETAITGGTYKFFVHLFGTSNRVDHCYLAGKTSEGPTLQIEVETEPNYHQVDYNHFGPRPPLGRNGGETIRVGYSHQSLKRSRTIVENNLFDRCDGELEIISNKSCDNIYRWNTFLECAGTLTLRHGDRCLVEGNFFLGKRKRGSGGIRVIGEEHTITNNYIDGTDRGGIWITAGIPDSPLNGYFRTRACLIAFNTIVDSGGPVLDLNAGFGTSKRSLQPEDITIANNLFSVPTSGTLFGGQEGNGFQWMGNIATNAGGALSEHGGIRVIDLNLIHAPEGMWRPAADGPTRSAAEGIFTAVNVDIDGQARSGKFDVGCDQFSDAPVIHRSLRAADVGLAWMNRE